MFHNIAQPFRMVARDKVAINTPSTIVPRLATRPIRSSSPLLEKNKSNPAIKRAAPKIKAKIDILSNIFIFLVILYISIYVNGLKRGFLW